MKEGNRSHFMKIRSDSWNYYKKIAEERGLTTLELLRKIVAEGERILAIELGGKGEVVWKINGKEVPLGVLENTDKKTETHLE
jgi:hypothetical protein